MEKGKIHIYTGDGHGKTPAALGEAIYAAAEGKQVIVIQFMKGQGITRTAFAQRLEPDIKFFCFEKSEEDYLDLNTSAKAEEEKNILNGINFAKKVLMTEGCDILILDEILALLDVGIITMDEFKSILDCKTDETTLIMTGIQLKDEVVELVDEVSKIETIKKSN